MKNFKNGSWMNRGESSTANLPEVTKPVNSNNPFAAYDEDHDDDDFEDDDTMLVNSMTSLSLFSSIHTMTEHSFSSSMANISTAATASTSNITTNTRRSSSSSPTKSHLCYHLQQNEHECFGYMKFQAQVSSTQSIPTELAILSGKPVFYAVTAESISDPLNSNRDKNVFLHPLITEALESLFAAVCVIPRVAGQPQQDHHESMLAIHDDEDAMTDDQGSPYGRPLYVSQIGFFDESGLDIVPPIAGEHLTLQTISRAILSVLMATQHTTTIPQYVREVVEEAHGTLTVSGCYVASTDGSTTAAATMTHELRRTWFGVEDLMAGEAAFRQLDGVHHVSIGSFDEYGDEDNNHSPVLQVWYNPRITSYSSLVRFALTTTTNSSSHSSILLLCQSNDERMAARVEATKLAHHHRTTTDTTNEGSQQQPHIGMANVDGQTFHTTHTNLSALRETPLRFVPMTVWQATKANEMIQRGRFDEAIHLLSPRQGLILMEATGGKGGSKIFCDVAGVPIREAWVSLSQPITCE